MIKDTVSIRIVKSSLDNIAKEMFWATVKTAKSSIIYETFDFAPALTNANGDLISIGTGIPVFLGVMPIIAKAVMEDIKIHDLGLTPGDIFVINDPYIEDTWFGPGTEIPLFDNRFDIPSELVWAGIGIIGVYTFFKLKLDKKPGLLILLLGVAFYILYNMGLI